jgi:hypothetical protein
MKDYSIIIETNSYAGNFEREMCAAITGAVGECGVGSPLDYDYSMFEGSIVEKQDENGFYRPVSIYPDANGNYNCIQIYFDSCPTKEQLKVVTERAHEFKETEYITNIVVKDVYVLVQEYVSTRINLSDL